MTDELKIYKQQISEHSAELKKLERRSILFGWLRLLSFILAAISIGWIWKNDQFILLPVTFLFIGIFLFILRKHLDNNEAIDNTRRLIKIINTEIEVLHHN